MMPSHSGLSLINQCPYASDPQQHTQSVALTGKDELEQLDGTASTVLKPLFEIEKPFLRGLVLRMLLAKACLY